MSTPKEQELITLQLRGYSLAELSKIYNVCDRTFKKWIKPFAAEIGAKQGRFYTIAQVKIILGKLGLPGEVTIKQSNVLPEPGISDTNQHNPA